MQYLVDKQERQGTQEVLDLSERFWPVLCRCWHSKVSPYDFGINFDWLDDTSKQRLLKERLRDWGKYGNPTGLEAKGDRHAAGEGSEVEGDGDAACEGPEAEGDVNVEAEEDDGMSDGDHAGNRDGAADDSEVQGIESSDGNQAGMMSGTLA